ncbi:YiiD C-terminal domain-containing protein [Mycobacterium sp. shizuoka-1]|jgi:thioesterase domain-containing protein|uniref:YiiD C-terminal domain-containing protein n=1 Tax=Mycobacteriaceae TaxID=1762 RepID=UPI000C061FD6|nr:YiiD C-terminal domain-containing protein [Mycobacterium sp. shizuoka-1]GAY15811.1 hypothetical protein MSZK_25370 [Mycobacterium sp. shizuoka-1]
MTVTADWVNVFIESNLPPVHRMGVQIADLRPGYAAAEVPLEGNNNHFGTVYAGIQFTVAEILGGAIGLATFDPTKYVGTVKSAQIDYLKPAGTKLRATTSLSQADVDSAFATLDATGNAEVVLDAEVTTEDGTIVAVTRSTYYVRTIGD